MWYVYMVRCADGSHYTGSTPEPERRMQEHLSQSSAAAKYTRSHKVVSLDCLWQADGKIDALRLEALIKHLPKEKKLALIEQPDSLEALFGEKLKGSRYEPVIGATLSQPIPKETNDP